MTRLVLILSLAACADTTTPTEDNEEEVITTVELVFSPTTGDDVVAAWSDPEDDGSPVIDDVALVAGEAYDLSIRFINDLPASPEDITEEVDAESDEHQIFLTGSAVSGPSSDATGAALTVAYADEDEGGLPVGLAFTVTTADEATTGQSLTVTLRHLPPENGSVVKVDGLAGDVLDGGVAALPGSTDATATFPVVLSAP